MARTVPEMDGGYVVSLNDLQQRLVQISGEDEWWELLPCKDMHMNGSIRPHAVVRYTNIRIMPNEPSFLFPIVTEGRMVRHTSECLVYLHPSLAISENDSLYWENEQLKYDSLQDFFYFWPPLRRSLAGE